MGRFSWLGIGLVLVGGAMLLDRIGVVQVGWQPVLWALLAVYGIVRAVDGFTKKKSGRVFWGTFLFLFGVYNALRDLDVVELRSYWLMPAMVLILGFSMLMMYMSSPKDWHLLIPAIALLGIGTFIILTEFGYFYRHDVIETFRLYWPIGFILFGLAIVVRRLSQHSRA